MDGIGKRNKFDYNRAELQKLLDIVNSGDTILATEVSRITRSTKQLCDIIEFAKALFSVLSDHLQISADCGELKSCKGSKNEVCYICSI